MTDGWISTYAGRHLRGRRKVNTVPEVLLRQALHRAGARFRLHVQLAKGCTPDIVMPGRSLVIFVDGCWWHSCPRHGRRTPFTGPNARLWVEKMQRNAERDRRSTALAQDLGWTVVRVWECEVREDEQTVVARVLGEDPSRGVDEN